MAAEIERKFLVKAGWQPQDEGVRIAQGYLSWVCQEFCVNRFNKQHRIAA